MQEIITKIIIGAAAAWAIYRIFKWFGRRQKIAVRMRLRSMRLRRMRRMRAAFGLRKRKAIG